MKKIPTILITGVPNTGKSTLFNRLIGKRKALVHSEAGMTRDIYKKPFEIEGRNFYLQDSGGFFPDDQLISQEINKRIISAAQKSDLVIFLFDGKRELLGYEKDLFLEIKKQNDNFISVINKVDNPNKFILPSSYYELKQDFILISAEHNLEIDELLEAIVNRIDKNAFASELPEESVARISILGKPNVGKSSIINKILNDEMVIVSPLPGTTRDSVDLEVKRKGKTFILVDNAGIRKIKKVKEETEVAAVIRAEKDIRYADILILVLDISKKIDQNDLMIAQKLLKSAKPVIIACNKWDLVMDKSQPEKLLRKVRQRLNFLHFSPIFLVSAVTGKNVFHIIDGAEKIHHRLNQKIKASELNQKIQQILLEKRIHTETHRFFKPKYIAIGSYRPFFIHFYTSTGQRLTPSHEIYIKKRITEELNLQGIPVFFKVMGKNKSKKDS